MKTILKLFLLVAGIFLLFKLIDKVTENSYLNNKKKYIEVE